jgi:hypothetical protein
MLCFYDDESSSAYNTENGGNKKWSSIDNAFDKDEKITIPYTRNHSTANKPHRNSTGKAKEKTSE